MKINQITEQVWQALPHREYLLYSFDVTVDGTKALLALCSEDPDFPELWKYDSLTNRATRLDDHSVLINFPLTKAFWAENQQNVIITSSGDKFDFTQLIIDADLDELIEMQIVENPSNYILKKDQEIIDFTRL